MCGNSCGRAVLPPTTEVKNISESGYSISEYWRHTTYANYSIISSVVVVMDQGSHVVAFYVSTVLHSFLSNTFVLFFNVSRVVLRF